MKKKFITIQTWVAASTSLFFAHSSLAQKTDSISGKALSEIMVTATRSEKKTEDVGRGITVISQADIQKSIYRNASDLLAQQAGIYIVGAGQNTGMPQSIFLRGSNSNQTTILIDGVRITDPSGINNALDLTELSLTNVEQIEIVRGSHSTLYGSSAIGGVVNIITKKNNQPGFKPTAELVAGKFGKGTGLTEQKLNLQYTKPIGFYLHAGAANQRIQGIDATIDTVTNRGSFQNRDQDNFSRQEVSGKMGYRTDNWDVYTSYKKTDLKADYDKREYTDDDNAYSAFNRHLFTYGAAYKINAAFQLRYIGGFSRMFRTTEDDSSAVNETRATDQTFVSSGNKGSIKTDELQANFTWRHITAVLGGGRYNETMTARNFYYTRQFGGFTSASDLDTLGLEATTKNVFVHLDINGGLLSEKLTKLSLGLGSRYNRHSKFGNFTTFELNPSYKITAKTLFYGVIASGFNAPSLYQLYAPNKNFTSNITRGNQKLSPETSISYEIGFKQNLGGSRLGISYFHTEVKNTIDYVYLWAADKPSGNLTFMDYMGDTYINLSRQITRGLELDFMSQLSTKVGAGGNISFVNGTLHIKPGNIEAAATGGNQVQLYSTGDFISKGVKVEGLARRPNTANIYVNYLPVNKVSLRMDARYAGARSDIFYDANRGPFGALGTKGLPDYTLLDFTGQYKIAKQFVATLRLENAFNTQYQEINGYSTRGRSIYLSLRYGF